MNSINRICKDILKITEEEFSELEEISKSQADYIHPLKMATQFYQHKLAEHNMKVLKKLRELQNTIKSGMQINKTSKHL